MKKIALLSWMMLVVMAVLSGTAYAKEKTYNLYCMYEVEKGDTLWAISEEVLGEGRWWKRIAEANSVDDPKTLQIGKLLVIPQVESGDVERREAIDNIVKKKISRKVHSIEPEIYKIEKKSSQAKVKLGTTKENPAPYTDDEVGDNPWRGGILKALELLGIEIPEGTKEEDIHYSYEGNSTLSEGEIILMLSGKDIVKYYDVHLSPEMAGVIKLGIVIDGEKVAYLYQKPQCANWLLRMETPEPAKKSESSVERFSGISPPGIRSRDAGQSLRLVYKKIKNVPPCRDFELTGGTGLMQNPITIHFQHNRELHIFLFPKLFIKIKFHQIGSINPIKFH